MVLSYYKICMYFSFIAFNFLVDSHCSEGLYAVFKMGLLQFDYVITTNVFIPILLLLKNH